MITLKELLEDSTYKKFFLSKPELAVIPRTSPPWRVYVQKRIDLGWACRDMWTYVDAFKLLKKYLPDVYDATIQSRGTAFKPPHKLVRVTKSGKPIMIRGSNGKLTQRTKIVFWTPHLPADETIHHWCPYCRRPVVIGWFSKHHTFSKAPFDPTSRRCPICGASEMLMAGLR